MGNSYTLVDTKDDREKIASELSTDRINGRDGGVFQIRKPIHEGTINSMVAIEKGSSNLVVSAGVDENIIVQDIKDTKSTGTFTTKWKHKGGITKLAYKRVLNNEFVVSGSTNGTICLWQFGVAAPICMFEVPEEKIGGLTTIDENIVVVGGSKGTLRAFDVNVQASIRSVGLSAGNEVTHVAKSPDDQILAQTSSDRTVNYDGLYCATSSDGTKHEGCEVTIWDLRQHRPLQHMHGHDAAVRSVVFLPQQVTWKKLLMSTSDDHQLMLWEKDVAGSIWQEDLIGCKRLNSGVGFIDGFLAVGGEDGAFCCLKLCSKRGHSFLATKSLQTLTYNDFEVDEELEVIGIS
ncbi:WD-REPEATS-REGION domain-containing protein [Aphelenchoides besseyi]|nr:WD-REPEATS-REGION domain-containing protein [Aphelenchoides besseyi]KAI6193719.1 WD-REPEATS-REGION domain-containing protein [Aphelenchoides besseyi]